MQSSKNAVTFLISATLCCVAATSASAQNVKFVSHPPMRPLAQPSQRPMAKGPSLFVDVKNGKDTGDGSKSNPWKTLAHAVEQLKPGDTLYLRGGIYREHVTVRVSGTAEKPITIRSYPGELAIIDGGLSEFYEHPETAWEPCPNGVAGEYWSAKTYPDLGGSAGGVNVLGNFGDSMVPLHGARYIRDLRSNNVYWHSKVRSSETAGIYCGPSIFYDVETGRIHARLAHTKMKYLPAGDNYEGETDPRKVPLIIAGFKGGSPLVLEAVQYVRLQDLVVRGSRVATVEISDCVNIELDGLTIYGGSAAILVRDTFGLRVVNTVCRGIAAPWTFRGSLKYRSIEARIFSASGWSPTGKDNRDFEIAYSEFTDCVDGIFIGNVKRVNFHHNYVDNLSDDGLFLTATTAYDGTTPGGDVHIHQNLLSRCLTTFAFGVGHGRQKVLPDGLQTGSGVWIYRNVFDFRRPVMYHQPGDPKGPQEVTSIGRFASDHGGPAWEPMYIYHNTIIADDPPRYSYATAGLGDHMSRGTTRRVFNNIITHIHGLPGAHFPPVTSDFQADYNLHWSVKKGADVTGDFFAKFRQSKAFAESKKQYAPGWGAHDRFTDPKFVKIETNWRNPCDLRLQPRSPAVDAGMMLPADWIDPVRGVDKGKPDLGALPLGVEPWHVGQHGRLTMFGQKRKPPTKIELAPISFPENTQSVPETGAKPAAIVEGYPARDVPLLAFVLRRLQVPVDIYPKEWLAPKEYKNYHLVALVGDLARAKIDPYKYTAEDLKKVDQFLKKGGTLLLTLRGRQAFATDHGKAYFQGLIGVTSPEEQIEMRISKPQHSWVKHLKPDHPLPWLKNRRAAAEHSLRASKGERIIGTPEGYTVLYRVPVGKGQLIYVGWEIAASLPATRDKLPTLDEERSFEEQMQILTAIVSEIYGLP